MARPLENPSFNPVLGYESQLFVKRFALRSSVQLHRGHFLLIEVLDGSFEQICSNAPTSISRVHQDHADPCKFVFEGDGRRRSADFSLHFGDETSLPTRVEKSIPVRSRLIPSRELFQAEPHGNVVFGHGAESHASEVPANCKPHGSIPEAFDRMEEGSCTKDKAQDAPSAVRVQSRVSFRTGPRSARISSDHANRENLYPGREGIGRAAQRANRWNDSRARSPRGRYSRPGRWRKNGADAGAHGKTGVGDGRSCATRHWRVSIFCVGAGTTIARMGRRGHALRLAGPQVA